MGELMHVIVFVIMRIICDSKNIHCCCICPSQIVYSDAYLVNTTRQEKKGRAMYYIRKRFTPYESRYTLSERVCCALTWLAQKLRHYLSSYTTYLISRMDPLKYIFQMAMLTGKLAKWKMLLSEFG